MRKLWSRLSPFAPDTSGACSALYDLGALVLIHNAQGCKTNYSIYDEPRWEERPQALFCTELPEMDIVLGNERALLEKALGLIRQYSPSFVALLGSPIPMLIGTDLNGLALELEEESGIPVIGIDTTGHRYYDSGASLALLQLARRFLPSKPGRATNPDLEAPARDGASRSVNILGANPLDLGYPGLLPDLKQWLKENNYQVTSCWNMDATLDQLSIGGEAGVNLVVSWSGLALARRMEETLGIPYVTGLPIGKKGGDLLLSQLEKASSPLSLQQETDKAQQSSTCHKVLIVGEQIQSLSLRRCLEADFGIKGVHIASFFNMDPRLMDSGDQKLEGEDSLHELLARAPYSLLIGDPFLENFLPPQGDTMFWPLPHMPVSSQFFMDKFPELIGSKGNQWVGTQFYASRGDSFEKNCYLR